MPMALRRFGSLLQATPGKRCRTCEYLSGQFRWLCNPLATIDADQGAGISEEVLGKLTDRELLHGACLIGGERVSTLDSGRVVEVLTSASRLLLHTTGFPHCALFAVPTIRNNVLWKIYPLSCC